MKVAFISTAAIAQTTRHSISETQSNLLKAQEELATGRHQDVGLELGYRTGRAVAMRQQFDELSAIGENNGVLAERLDVTQNALGQMVERAQSMMATLLGARNSSDGPAVAAAQAHVTLGAMGELLNTSYNGVHVFAGINSDTAPLADYFADPTSPAKQAVDADFLAAFGIAQGAAGAEAIDAASMRTFLDGAFAGNFDSAAWTANWSSASSQVLTSRISVSMTLETSVSANDAPLRQLAEALTMVADLGADSLNQATFQVIADTSTELLGEAINGLTLAQSALAVSQEGIRSANERMELQKQVLTGGLSDLESVDSYEAATRATALLTQLETSFAMTARIQRLTLANYL